jgi:hypothetical protein
VASPKQGSFPSAFQPGSHRTDSHEQSPEIKDWRSSMAKCQIQDSFGMFGPIIAKLLAYILTRVGPRPSADSVCRFSSLRKVEVSLVFLAHDSNDKNLTMFLFLFLLHKASSW